MTARPYGAAPAFRGKQQDWPFPKSTCRRHLGVAQIEQFLQMKTNATRLLEKAGIHHSLAHYEVDPNDLSAPKVAAQIGMPPTRFKTLLAKGNTGGLLFAVLPGDQELDLKVLARVSGNRSIELVPVNQLQTLTGYIRGGVTALAAKKSFPVFLDGSALQFSVIAVSAGIRGAQILLAPSTQRITAAQTAVLSRPQPGTKEARHVRTRLICIRVGPFARREERFPRHQTNIDEFISRTEHPSWQR